MLDLILEFARADERIRAVILNGSRVNPDAPKDIFQDYDIIFTVTAMDEFIRDRSWIQHFGELIIIQTPDENALFPSDNASFAFLMLFQDGNRIDLTLYPTAQPDSFQPESLSLVLLDKDNLLQSLPAPSNRDYRTLPPTAAQFVSCCNEFWWVSTYVAKGLWRRELPYARFMIEGPVRDMLALMLKWYIGVQSGFSADAGKLGKYFEKHLPLGLWEAYAKTFADAEYDNIWRALFAMGDLFRKTATQVAQQFDYEYPSDDDERVTAYLRHVRDLPYDAGEVYPSS